MAQLSDLDLFQRDAYEAVLRQFKQYGLESLASKILDMVKAGFDGETISLMLQDTDEYKKRFAGNQARAKAGLPVLTPAEYIQTERAYAQVMRAFGLPPTFYDQPEDFADFISRDVAPAEVQRRVEAAARFVTTERRDYLDTMRSYYGDFTEGMAIAYLLDPKKATPVITRMIGAIEIGTEAARQGLTAPDRERAERLAELGVDADAARRGYTQVGEVLPVTERIAERFKSSYTQADAEDEFLTGLASARRKREQLEGAEKALFSGSGGVGRTSLSRDNTGSY